jgi:plasmid replication initiation protein
MVYSPIAPRCARDHKSLFTSRSTSYFASSKLAGIAYSIGMHLAVPGRRPTSKTVALDRSLEALPLFRLSDSADEGAITYMPAAGGRWRVLPAPGDRLPGTFDQDVYVEILHRFGEAGFPADGVVRFTLHSFLRSIGRKVDGRTYEQLRSALNRLERTRLESSGAYQVYSERSEQSFEGTFTILSSVTIERRRLTDRDQLALFSALSASEPGDARVVVSPQLRANIASGNIISLSLQHYGSLSNPVARRLYRLLATARSQDHITWRISLGALASQLPLTQRYPSHLQRVLQPAHEMLIAAGLLRDASFHQLDREWHVDYVLATRNTIAP